VRGLGRSRNLLAATSEPTQSPSTNIGRYTFVGDLNQFVEFQQPIHGLQLVERIG